MSAIQHDTMKQVFVSEVNPGDDIDSYFLVESQGMPRAYSNGKPGAWFRLEVSDKTGSMPVVFWGKDDGSVRELCSSFGVQDVVRVRGTATMYRDSIQISINQGYGFLEKIDEYDSTDLLPTSDLNIDDLKSHLLETIKNVKGEPLRLLLQSIFDDKTILERYASWPAAKNYHHGYVGGLIEHSLNMVHLAKAVAQNYESSLDVDMLTAGCILHDIGKLYQYDMDVGIAFTVDGQYLGHITMGAMLVSQHIERLRQSGVDFDNDTERHIIHIILSHHGTHEHGSPVTPATPEATVVHQVDACDAQTKHMIQESQ